MAIQNQTPDLEAFKENTPCDIVNPLEAKAATPPIPPTVSRVAPSLSPTENRENTDFSKIRQGTATNALTKFRAIEGKNTTVDNITGSATIKQGDVTLTLSDYRGLENLRVSTWQLLDIIIERLTKSGTKSPTVNLTLEDYMNKRRLKNRKEAKAQVKADLEILRRASLSWEEKRGKKVVVFAFVNLADSGIIKRKGDIIFTFGTTFYSSLLSYPVMPYPSQLSALNSKRNPNSYFLLRRISEHKNMNIGKKNEDVIAVKTLLAVASFIPSYEEVMATDRALNRRIIEPFERDMDALDETLTWEYCHSLGQPLTNTELENLTYDVFKGLLIRTSWKNYPDQTARLEKKAERIEQKKKRKTSKKKKSDTE